MKIGISGCRGIPNHYGGFEQFASFLSEGLVKRGHEVWVYNSSSHLYKEKSWRGVNIIHCSDPEKRLGTFGQFVYDFNCILDSRGRNFDILLQLGYTSSSVWHRLLPKSATIITNMDGLEWMRSKYSKPVRRFLKYAEKLAVKSSGILVADSKGIQDYLSEVYHASSVFIPYGAEPFMHPDPFPLRMLNLEPWSYHLLIARLEPENNIEAVLQAATEAMPRRNLLVIGNNRTRYGKYLLQKFRQPHIRFLGPVYDAELLNNLRHYCRLYFHGHSAGGTNPSLLEAMAAGALVCAHDNVFNRLVLEGDGYYFRDSSDVKELMESHTGKGETWRENNLRRIRERYNWESIISAYEEMFMERTVKS